MSFLFNPASKKDRDALKTPNGKRGVKLVIIFVVVVAIIMVVGYLMGMGN